MRILVVGGGGREHAICHKLKGAQLFCAPGNAGISQIATCVDIKPTDISKMVEFCVDNHIDLCVVAPDDPLVLGMVDEMQKVGVKCFGPTKSAAIIEGSKSFSKELMQKYNIPTANYRTFTDCDDAISYLKTQTFPIVIKADGLALGKGVIIAQSFDDACGALSDMMCNNKFGDAGKTVVIEEFLVGQEISVLAFTDGKTVVPMPSAQDHKRALDNDEGPNTGGMGAFSPSFIYDDTMHKECMEKIFLPTMNALNQEGRTFKGVIYFGLMATADGVKVIEYNARFGDPEAQCVLMRLKSDLATIMLSVCDSTLAQQKIEWDLRPAVCVVAASDGYPTKYSTGYKITGLEETENVVVFHAGTKLEKDGIVTSGGRVLGVTAIGDDFETARKNAYDALGKIHFENIFYRKDIGIKK